MIGSPHRERVHGVYVGHVMAAKDPGTHARVDPTSGPDQSCPRRCLARAATIAASTSWLVRREQDREREDLSTRPESPWRRTGPPTGAQCLEIRSPERHEPLPTPDGGPDPQRGDDHE